MLAELDLVEADLVQDALAIPIRFRIVRNQGERRFLRSQSLGELAAKPLDDTDDVLGPHLVDHCWRLIVYGRKRALGFSTPSEMRQRNGAIQLRRQRLPVRGPVDLVEHVLGRGQIPPCLVGTPCREPRHAAGKARAGVVVRLTL